jgi:hypothetical protein
MGDWNHFKITQTIPEQYIRKARNYENTKKQPYWALHTHTTESANVKVQNILQGRNNMACSTNCNAKQLQHYIP